MGGIDTAQSRTKKRDGHADAIERPPSLKVDALVEALDVQNLWYPARVVATTASKVLLAFDGWSADWNEWVDKGSARIRAHRGWGTKAKPHDWQTDSIILALDMEGRWCKAKVLHVSEDSVHVHYQKWSSKWDEWVDKCTVRAHLPPARSLRRGAGSWAW